MEVSVMMLGDHIVEELSDIQDSYRVISKELTLEEWRKRPRWQRYVDNVARLTATLQ
jgi:cardiolipin synthase